MTWKDVGNLRGEMGATGPQGATGETGPAGAPFTIYRTYATIALMEADFANVPDGSFVAIQSNVEDPDNAKLYLRGNSEFTFITDMSGATGIHGDKGDTGDDGKAGAQILLSTSGRNGSLSSTGCPAQPTLYIATEQDLSEIQTMMLAFLSNVDESHIVDGKYEGDERERVIQAAMLLKESPLYVEHLPNFSLQDVENKIKKNIRDHDVRYVFNPKRVLGE